MIKIEFLKVPGTAYPLTKVDAPTASATSIAMTLAYGVENAVSEVCTRTAGEIGMLEAIKAHLEYTIKQLKQLQEVEK